jgi:hypothetical protein
VLADIELRWRPEVLPEKMAQKRLRGTSLYVVFCLEFMVRQPYESTQPPWPDLDAQAFAGCTLPFWAVVNLVYF